MAKKEKEEKSEVPSSLNDAFAQLVKQHNNLQQGAASYGEEDFGSNVDLWIPTGSIALDTIISNKADKGGWPCGRVVELYGEQAYGKSSLCFQGMANCQKMGGVVIFFDIESAASMELMEAYGIDTSKIIYSNLELVEDIFDAMEKNLTTITTIPALKNKPIFIVVDSLAAMKSRKLVEGSYDYNMNTQGEQAKILGLALKRMLGPLRKANACLIIINQMRDMIGKIGGDLKYAPGGNALKFYATLRLRLLGKKLITEIEGITGEAVPIGAEVTVRTDKNKLGPPMRAASFNLMFTSGVSEESEWVVYLTNLGYITQGGAWYTWTENFPDKSFHGKKFQRKDFTEFLVEEKNYKTIVKAIKEGFVRDITDTKLVEEQEKVEGIQE